MQFTFSVIIIVVFRSRVPVDVEEMENHHCQKSGNGLKQTSDSREHACLAKSRVAHSCMMGPSVGVPFTRDWTWKTRIQNSTTITHTMGTNNPFPSPYIKVTTAAERDSHSMLLSALLVFWIAALESRAFQVPPPQAKTTRSPPLVSGVKSSAQILEGMGMPSNPGLGWSGRLNRLTKWTEEKKPNRPIIRLYEPSGLWLWRQWKGTVLKSTWRSVFLAMSAGLALSFFFSSRGRSMFSLPTATDPLIQCLAGLNKIFKYHLTLATFILTFFLSQAFSYWQKVYNTTRAIQGRINDFCMLLSMGAQRVPTTKADDKVNSSGYSDESQELVSVCTRLIRVCHIFFWAATPTASNGLNDSERFIIDAEKCPLPVDDDHIGPLLLSPYGLKALVKTGQLTKEEAESLTMTDLPPSQYAYILLVWVGLHCMTGMEDGRLRGGPGFEENVLRQLTSLRASMVSVQT